MQDGLRDRQGEWLSTAIGLVGTGSKEREEY